MSKSKFLFQLNTYCKSANQLSTNKWIRIISCRLHYNNTNNNNNNNSPVKNHWARVSPERRKAIRTKIINEFKERRNRVGEMIGRENIWTVPNFLCVGRIISTPCLSYFIVSHDYQIALWLLGFAGLTDFADGWIARTWTSQASKLGSFLDPMADKLLVGSLFLSLAWVGLIPVPLTALVVSRDVMLIGAASYIRYRSLPAPRTLSKYFDPTYATVQLSPTFTSKINTAVQLALVASTLAAPVFHFVDHPVLQGLCYLTAITTVAGGVSYLMSENTYKYLSTKNKFKKSSS